MISRNYTLYITIAIAAIWCLAIYIGAWALEARAMAALPIVAYRISWPRQPAMPVASCGAAVIIINQQRTTDTKELYQLQLCFVPVIVGPSYLAENGTLAKTSAGGQRYIPWAMPNGRVGFASPDDYDAKAEIATRLREVQPAPAEITLAQLSRRHDAHAIRQAAIKLALGGLALLAFCVWAINRLTQAPAE